MAPGVFVSRCQMLLKINFTRYGLKTLVSAQNNNKLQEGFSIRHRFYTTTLDTGKSEEDVIVHYRRGLPHVTVPLPSRNERCQFTLKPISQNVGDFLEMLRAEDRGIDRATILNKDGVRISSACSIDNLMDDDFWLHVNDKSYFVSPPTRERISGEELVKLGDVQALVAQLYEALHVGEHQIRKEKDLYAKLEDLNMKLGPLEQKKAELQEQAVRRTNVLTWVGLGLMSVQFGILARLTWWEYSWDIMEPVTYFVTYGTAMAAYAYYVLTKQEYNLPEVRDRQYLLTIHKKAKKGGLDLDEYNILKREVAEIEHDLKRLRDPLQIHLPTKPPKPMYKPEDTSSSSSSSKETSSFKLKSTTTGITDLINSTKNKLK